MKVGKQDKVTTDQYDKVKVVRVTRYNKATLRLMTVRFTTQEKRVVHIIYSSMHMYTCDFTYDRSIIRLISRT